MAKGYSIKFNEKKGLWLAKYKDSNGIWKQKSLPSQFTKMQPLEAEQSFLGWYLQYKNNPESIKLEVTAGFKKTIRLLSDKWLQLREKDTGTKPNTYRGFQVSMRTWILNSKFKHAKIEHLDIETELTVEVVREWIQSMVGIKYASRITHIRTLKVMLNDCAGEGWISEDYNNPLEKKPIKKIIADLAKARKSNQEIITIPVSNWHAMMDRCLPKIDDLRKVRSLLALLTGLRDHEIQALTFNDLKLKEEIPYLQVTKQLDQIGSGPPVKYEDLVEAGKSKADIKKSSKAIISKPKYDSCRLVPLHPLLVKVLRYWKEYGWREAVGFVPQETDPVFARSKVSIKNGKAGDYCFVESSVLIKKDLERASQASVGITFHSCRRTFATMLADAGAEESKIGTLLGHAAATTAAQNYIGKNLPSFYQAIKTLPTPSAVVLRRITISEN